MTDDPEAMRYGFDGFGYKYIDSGSGSDWRTRHPDAEPLYLGLRTMTKEQLNALEAWITAIIREEDKASGVEEVCHLIRMREAVEIAFGLRDTDK